MSLRVRLVEPRPPGRHVYDRALLPRLGLPLMGAMLAETGHDVACYCEAITQIDRADCVRADLVGISSTTSTQIAAYDLADELGRAGVPVVLGGPHVSFMADEALAHAPYVVRGEGQRTLMELVDALERGAPLGDIAGLSWRDAHGDMHHNEARPKTSQAEFVALPAPDLSLIAGHEKMTVTPVMTQWGCPYDCDFCSVTAMFSRVVRHRTNEQVLDELARIRTKRVFFHDDNFVAQKRRARELMQAMVARDLTPSWLAQVRADVVFTAKSRSGRLEEDREFLKLMRAAGCLMVMVGFESITDEGLEAIGKQLRVQDIVRAVDLFHRYGIPVHGMFVVGLDTDGPGHAEATVDFAKKLGIDTVQLMMETPLPGTRLFRRAEAEGRILTRDWSLYDGHHAVMQPARMDADALQQETIGAMERFYRRSTALGSAVRLTGRFTKAALRGRVFDRVERDRVALVPLLRRYGRGQLASWREQERERALAAARLRRSRSGMPSSTGAADAADATTGPASLVAGALAAGVRDLDRLGRRARKAMAKRAELAGVAPDAPALDE